MSDAPAKYLPVKGRVYTTGQIDNALDLRDSPNLGFYNIDKEKDVVQDSHLAVNLSTLPGWNHLRWTFIGETHEWIPLFQIVEEDEPKLLKLLRESDTEGPDEVAVYYPHIPAGFDEKGRPVKPVHVPKTYTLYDKERHVDTEESRGPFNLLSLIHTTDWSDEEFDKITDLTVGQVLEFDNGRLVVTRVS